MSALDSLVPGAPLSLEPADIDIAAGQPRYLLVGSPGDLHVTAPGGAAVVFKNVGAWQQLDIVVRQVNAATTAGEILGFY